MKEREFIENIYLAASKKYNPAALCKYLKRDGDVFIVDKDLAINTTGGDRTLFSIMMNALYGFDYSLSFDKVTIYLEPDGKVLRGGIYDLTTHEKITSRRVATSYPVDDGYILSEPGTHFIPYIYPEKKMAEIMEIFQKTS